jgi:recombination protein RecA
LDIRRIETLKEADQAVGNRVRVRVVKNKVAPPFKQAEFDIMYGTGISVPGEVLDMAVEHKVVQKSGAWFSNGDLRLGQGRENVKSFLRDNPELLERLRAEIVTAVDPAWIKNPVAAAPAEVAAPDSTAPGKGEEA